MLETDYIRLTHKLKEHKVIIKVKNIYQKILVGYFIVLVGYWTLLHRSGLKDTNWNYAYSTLFSLTPLVVGCFGMFASRIWGALKSSIGKSVLFFSLGLFLWGAGSMVWSYYNFIPRVPAPYPSLADIGFAPSIFFWCLGAVFLSKATGARFAFKKSNILKVLTLVCLVGLTLLGYYALVKVARGGVVVPEGETPLKVILDIAYPLGDFIALVLSVIIFGLSFKYFGGRYKLSIISILAGLGVMFVGDFVFSYTITAQTFFVGDFGDFILTTGLALLSFGVLGFATTPSNEPKQKLESGAK